MPIRDFYGVFPALKDSPHRETSPRDINYNCTAWAVADQRRWWEPWGVIVPRPPPEYHWPDRAEHSYSVQAYAQALGTQGYAACENGDLQDGVSKIALYTVGEEVRHVARQLGNGRWTSKLGVAEDIEHTLEALSNGDGPYGYGRPTHFFGKPSA